MKINWPGERKRANEFFKVLFTLEILKIAEKFNLGFFQFQQDVLSYHKIITSTCMDSISELIF